MTHAVVLDQNNVDTYISMIKNRIMQGEKLSISIETDAAYRDSISYVNEERDTFPSMDDAVSSLGEHNDR